MTPRSAAVRSTSCCSRRSSVTTWAQDPLVVRAGQVTLEDILALLFLLVFAVDRLVRRDWTLPRGAIALLLVLLGLEAVFLLGFFDLDTHDALDQYAKGMTKYLVHFVFLVAASRTSCAAASASTLITVGALCGGHRR